MLIINLCSKKTRVNYERRERKEIIYKISFNKIFTYFIVLISHLF